MNLLSLLYLCSCWLKGRGRNLLLVTVSCASLIRNLFTNSSDRLVIEISLKTWLIKMATKIELLSVTEIE